MDENKRKSSEKTLRKIYELYICNRENTNPINSKLAEAIQNSIEQTAKFEELLDEETLIEFDKLCDVNIDERDESDYEIFLNGFFFGFHFGYFAEKHGENIDNTFDKR